MPDEITPEQWRAWGENPCTQRLLAKLEGDAAAWDEMAAGARMRAIKELDGGGANLIGEHEAMQDYRQTARLSRAWANAVRAMSAPQGPAADEPRRVTVKG